MHACVRARRPPHPHLRTQRSIALLHDAASHSRHSFEREWRCMELVRATCVGTWCGPAQVDTAALSRPLRRRGRRLRTHPLPTVRLSVKTTQRPTLRLASVASDRA